MLNRKFYYNNDRMGSSTHARMPDGTIAAWASYDAWGVITSVTDFDINMSGVESILSFTTYDFDRVLNLYFANARFFDAEDKRFTQVDLVKDGVNWFVYCGGDPINNVDMSGFMAVEKLRMIEDLYMSGLIPDDKLGTVVLLANLGELSMTTLNTIKNAVTFNFNELTRDFDETVKDADPAMQSIYLSFHETAQILAAKAIRDQHPELADFLHPYPILENRVQPGGGFSSWRELDVSWGHYVWEVKPGYSASSVFTASLKKYVNGYSPSKEPGSYVAGSGWSIPGGRFNDVEVELFRLKGYVVKMIVKWLGEGKVGYFFKINCRQAQETFSEADAKEISKLLMPAFSAAKGLDTITDIGLAMFALLVTAATPWPGDEEVALANLLRILSNLRLLCHKEEAI